MSDKIYTNSAEIINAYAHGELTLEECNRRLKEMGSAPLRNPLEPKITPALVLWDSEAGRAIPIGYGVLSADELQDRIFLLTSKEAGHDF